MKSGLMGALAFLVSPRISTAYPAPHSIKRLVGLLHDQESARAIGRAYLLQEPSEADATCLVALLDPGGVAARGKAELRRTIAARHREDFGCGRTVILDGWILSRTEVRLCALATIAPSNVVE